VRSIGTKTQGWNGPNGNAWGDLCSQGGSTNQEAPRFSGGVVHAYCPSALFDLPCITTVDALWLVHTKTGTTFRAGPPDCFLRDKSTHSDSLDTLQVCDDAYPVSCPVAGVKMKQNGTGIPGAGKAKLMAARGEFFTVLHRAGNTGVRLVPVPSPATGAHLTFSIVCAA
jgi:hypothetical protein